MRRLLSLILALLLATPAYAATLTVYPDASSGATTADGAIQVNGQADWATARGASSGDAYVNDVQIFIMQVYRATAGTYALARSIFTLDTSVGGTNPLAGATINSAVFSVYGAAKSDTAGNTPDTVLVGSTPANNNAVVGGDFDQLGTTLYSSVKAYADFSVDAYNDYTLNTAGKSAISTTGITRLGIRNDYYDIQGNTPPNASPMGIANRTDGYFADQTGTTSDPKLVIDYTEASSGGNPILLF